MALAATIAVGGMIMLSIKDCFGLYYNGAARRLDRSDDACFREQLNFLDAMAAECNINENNSNVAESSLDFSPNVDRILF